MYDYNSYDYYQNNYRQSGVDLEGLYPDIYKIVYPLIKKTCEGINEPVTKEVIDKMVDNIYINIEGNDMVQVNVNNRNAYKSTYESLKKEINEKLERKNDFKYIPEPKKEVRGNTEEKRGDRQFNRGLSDLIRILLIRELTGRPVFPGNRPPFGPPPPPPPPGRPPYGRPPFSMY